MAFVIFGDAHLNCIVLIKIFGLDSADIRHKQIDSTRVDRIVHVLVEIAKPVQLPKGMISRRVRPFVRLGSVNLFRNLVGEHTQRVDVAPPSVFVGKVLVKRKALAGSRLAALRAGMNVAMAIMNSKISGAAKNTAAS